MVTGPRSAGRTGPDDPWSNPQAYSILRPLPQETVAHSCQPRVGSRGGTRSNDHPSALLAAASREAGRVILRLRAPFGPFRQWAASPDRSGTRVVVAIIDRERQRKAGRGWGNTRPQPYAEPREAPAGRGTCATLIVNFGGARPSEFGRRRGTASAITRRVEMIRVASSGVAGQRSSRCVLIGNRGQIRGTDPLAAIVVALSLGMAMHRQVPCSRRGYRTHEHVVGEGSRVGLRQTCSRCTGTTAMGTVASLTPARGGNQTERLSGSFSR